MPQKTENGRIVWIELQGFEWDVENQEYLTDLNSENFAIWDQEHLAYRYTNTETDPGHDQFFLPMMGVNKEYDFDEGRVNLCETFQTDDFEKGISGVRLDFFISDAHKYVKWWTNAPDEINEIANQLISEMYLENFSWLKGKQVIIRVVAKDWTSSAFRLKRETYFPKSPAHIVNAWKVGFLPEIAPNLHYITLSLNESVYTKPDDSDNPTFAITSHLATLWAIQVYMQPDKIIDKDDKPIIQGLFYPIHQELSDAAEVQGVEGVDLQPKN